MNARTSSRTGLTLVEVMLAVTIPSIGLVVLIASAGRAVAVAKKSKEYETARKLLADLELNEPLQLDDLEEGSEDGTFPEPYRSYRWERDLTIVGAEEDEMYEVRTRIIWPTSYGTEKKEEVVTLLHLSSAKRNGFIHEDAQGRTLDEK